ncbi:MAG: SUMF1/EgtB/PvdO family nonheme iron enzyme, partial [Anaerolineae bacterium]
CGCTDMVGNVSEWTLTKYTLYPYEPGDGRDDPAGEFERVTRGGSWHSPVLRARTSSRGMNDPYFADNDLGFRCVS